MTDTIGSGSSPVMEQALDTLATSRNAAARRQAASTLGQDGGPWAIQALVGALRHDPAPTVRAAAEEALMGLGAAAVPALTRVLLVRPTRQNAPERQAARRLLAGTGAAAVNAVAAGLTSRQRSIRAEASRALADIGEPAVGMLLRYLCHHEDENVRHYAAQALVQIGQPVVPGVAALLHPPSGGDGAMVAWVVGTSLQVPSEQVRSLAAKVLGKIGGPTAMDALRKTWDSDPSYFAREQARRSLLD